MNALAGGERRDGVAGAFYRCGLSGELGIGAGTQLRIGTYGELLGNEALEKLKLLPGSGVCHGRGDQPL